MIVFRKKRRRRILTPGERTVAILKLGSRHFVPAKPIHRMTEEEYERELVRAYESR